jgi:hypothetical protein
MNSPFFDFHFPTISSAIPELHIATTLAIATPTLFTASSRKLHSSHAAHCAPNDASEHQAVQTTPLTVKPDGLGGRQVAIGSHAVAPNDANDTHPPWPLIGVGDRGAGGGGNRFAGKSPSFNGRRQPSRDGTSRMSREAQVRICERLGVKLPGPTRQERECRQARRDRECNSVTRRSRRSAANGRSVPEHAWCRACRDGTSVPVIGRSRCHAANEHAFAHPRCIDTLSP